MNEGLYEGRIYGTRWPEKISTRWPAHCHVTVHVTVHGHLLDIFSGLRFFLIEPLIFIPLSAWSVI